MYHLKNLDHSLFRYSCWLPYSGIFLLLFSPHCAHSVFLVVLNWGHKSICPHKAKFYPHTETLSPGRPSLCGVLWCVRVRKQWIEKATGVQSCFWTNFDRSCTAWLSNWRKHVTSSRLQHNAAGWVCGVSWLKLYWDSHQLGNLWWNQLQLL